MGVMVLSPELMPGAVAKLGCGLQAPSGLLPELDCHLTQQLPNGPIRMGMLNFADLAHREHQENRGFCKKIFAGLKNIRLPANDETENPFRQ